MEMGNLNRSHRISNPPKTNYHSADFESTSWLISVVSKADLGAGERSRRGFSPGRATTVRASVISTMLRGSMAQDNQLQVIF